MANDITFPLPEDMTELLGTERSVDKRKGKIQEWSYHLAEQQDNLHLAFYRFVPRQPRKKPFKDDYESKYLQALADRWNGDGRWRRAAAAIAMRQQAQLGALRKQGWKSEGLELETAGRLISGLGYKNALEVGLTLHPLYGVPYLPGTAVKGVACAWAKQVKEADDVPKVFGSPSTEEKSGGAMQLGAVRFFDAFPTEFPKLEVDVMTPHYSDYYTGNAPPGDWQEPKPVNFLTVAAGQPFGFSLASRDEDALEAAVGWLRNGLRELGAGGKTSAGYGAFWSKADRRKVETELEAAANKIEKAKSAAKSDEPEWLETVGSNTADIWAEVIDNSRRPLKVKVFVKDCKDEVFDCGGLRNLSEFPPGTRFYVRVGTYSKKKGLIDVTFQTSL